MEDKDMEITSVRDLLATADEALTARDSVVASLKAREAALTEKLDSAQATISEFEERVASLRKTSDSLQEQVIILSIPVQMVACVCVAVHVVSSLVCMSAPSTPLQSISGCA